MDRRETLIPRGDPTAASLLHILEESSGAGWRNVFHSETLNPSVSGASDEGQKLLQHIPIALLRIVRKIPLGNEML